MPQLPTVRIAQPDDADAIMAMCHRLWEENGLFTYSEEKVFDCLKRCYTEKGTIVGVIGEPGRIEASTCMGISDYYYTHDWHLAEYWNYVQPEYRKSRNAEALIEFGKACAEKMGIPLITGIVTNKRMAGKVRLYRRMLGYPSGVLFVHNSRWRSEPMEDHSDLCLKLKEFSSKCSNGKVSTSVARKQVGPLLKEAAEVINREDNLFVSAKSNGAHPA